MATLGELIKTWRATRGWSQEQLGEHCVPKIPRTTIASLESRNNRRPSAETLAAIAVALDKPVTELYKAAGIAISDISTKPDTYIDHWERALAAAPVPIPVYSDFKVHMGGMTEMPVDYVYQSKEQVGSHHKEGLYCVGDCMEPLIHDGEIVIVDLDASPVPGNIVLCLTEDGLIVGHYIVEKGIPKIKNGQGTHSITECLRSAVVEGIYRKAPGF